MNCAAAVVFIYRVGKYQKIGEITTAVMLVEADFVIDMNRGQFVQGRRGDKEIGMNSPTVDQPKKVVDTG